MNEDLRESDRFAEVEQEAADRQAAALAVRYARKSGGEILVREERARVLGEIANASLLGSKWNAFLDEFAAVSTCGR